MSSFTGNILLEQLGCEDMCEIKREFSYHSNDGRTLVVVKAGFRTDLASIPSCIKSFVRASPIHSWRAYVIHDALYRIGYDRLKSDKMLDDALGLLGLGGYARWKVYYGLRWFGKSTTDDALIENAHRYVEVVSYD